MKRSVHILIFLVLCTGSVLAQGSSTSSSYLSLPISARTASLGEATVADPRNFASSLLNPANLSGDGPATITLSHSQWIQGIKTEFAGTSIPFSFGTVGFAISNTNVSDIEIREQPGPPVGTFNAHFAAIHLSFARRVLDVVDVGGAVKYLYEKLYVDETTGYGLDLGALYRTPLEGLTAGLSVTNLGTLRQFRSEASQLPSAGRIGGNYSFSLGDFALRANAAVVENLYRSDPHTQLGLEAIYNGALAARLGYQTGYESRGLSAGLGFRYGFVQVDYAYLPFSLGLGDAHIFSLGFRF
jgi:hypothetical protein